MDIKKEQFMACKRIHERARYLRGSFLNSVACIERHIALILTDYFCTSDEAKRKLFFTDVVNAHFFSLNSKKEILVRIVKKDYPRFWDEKRDTLKALDEIMRFRNKLAHSVVDVSERALSRPLEEGIGFVEWKEGEPITEEYFQALDLKATMVLGCLLEIKRLLPFKENPTV